MSRIDKKLLILYLLNLSDALCTILLIHLNLCVEANPIMVELFEYPLIAFLFKAIVPGFLILLMRYLYQNSPYKTLDIASTVALIPYVLVNLLHGYHLLFIPL